MRYVIKYWIHNTELCCYTANNLEEIERFLSLIDSRDEFKLLRIEEQYV